METSLIIIIIRLIIEALKALKKGDHKKAHELLGTADQHMNGHAPPSQAEEQPEHGQD